MRILNELAAITTPMITFKSLWNDYKENSNYKYCFYHDKSECSTKIKKAHSLQKEKILTQLEAPVNGNNLIYSLNEFKEENFKTIELIPFGKNKASIFSGFCDFHDSKIFSPIENFSILPKPEHFFLLTYRAFAHGFHQLLETHNYYKSNGEFIKYFPQEYLQGHINLVQLRIERMLKYKNILDQLIRQKKYSGLNYHYRIFKPFIPLACSSLLSPFYTYKNIFLNPREDYSYLVLNIIPDNTQTIVIITHFKEDKKGGIFFEEFKTLSDSEFKEAISSLLIYCTTNTFFSPTLWDKFSDNEKRQLYTEIDFCINKGDKIEKFFISEIDFFKP
jgi:hypothetical protein